jgi:hypothetical protein
LKGCGGLRKFVLRIKEITVQIPGIEPIWGKLDGLFDFKVIGRLLIESIRLFCRRD